MIKDKDPLKENIIGDISDQEGDKWFNLCNLK
jgi:hypothetical protein